MKKVVDNSLKSGMITKERHAKEKFTMIKAGIIGAMSGVIGTLQATEAIKYLLGIGDLLTGRLLTYDALTMRFHTVNLPDNRKNCPVCSKYLDE